MAVSQGRDHHRQMHGEFRWEVPEYFNIAQVCCTRWAGLPDGADRVAIRVHGAIESELSYAQLQARADALSQQLASLGVGRGDRVAVLMPQRPETAIAYMAVFQLGAVAVPLTVLFGPDALAYRLQDSGAVVAISDEAAIASLGQARAECPALRTVIGVGGAAAQGDVALCTQLPPGAVAPEPVRTRADDGAVLIYTSGTTGPPKGAFIAHRTLIGNLPGFVCSQNWFGFGPGQTAQESDAVFWSPADWAWTGGLMDALLPTLYFGRPIIAWGGRFSPELAFELMHTHGVTHTFLFPTALKAMMKAFPEPRKHFHLRLEAIMSAGEAVGDAVFAYCKDQLAVTVNEMFGQTEINYVVGNCSMQWAGATHRGSGLGWPARPGSMGRPYPGHRVAVIDEQGRECPVGVPGDVAVNRLDIHGQPDPIFFLGYWKNDAATRDKHTGHWCRTGDLATRDADGYLWYQGRADDVFKAAGYRIGPSEVENCLVKHPAVANAAVVPKPDGARGAVVKAFVVLSPEFASRRREAGPQFDAQLIAQLQSHVRGKLAPYEYPKDIEFIDELPMTTTGKVQRRVLRLQEEEKARAL